MARGVRADEREHAGCIVTFWCKFMIRKPNKVSARVAARTPTSTHRMVEDIVGCKWSLTVLDLVSRGVARPGAMQKSIPGLSTKVLNERLRKLLRFGIIEREVFAEVPPHVEYRLTTFGRKFERLLQQIDQLRAEM
jgi:DNA-binding HxlR family transcriptional regulator